MYSIGVTGGVGSGKSLVMEYLRGKYGAFVLLLDELGHELILPGHACYEDTVSLFGREVLRDDGTIDRSRVGEKVFSDEVLLASYNAILHPAIHRETLRIMSRESEKGCALFAVEAALLLEAGYDAVCDETWYIYADPDTRSRRLSESRNYSPARIRDTMARQLPEEEFRRRCTYTIDNSGSFSAAAREIDRLLLRCLRNNTVFEAGPVTRISENADGPET